MADEDVMVPPAPPALGPGDEQAPSHGPGDEWSDVELEAAPCPACDGSGEDEVRRTRVVAFGQSYSPGDYVCERCEGSGYASPADAEIDALYACDCDDDVGPVEAHCG